MLYKKSIVLSVGVVFSCAGMERSQQSSIQSQHVAFSDAGSQTNQESFSGNNLAQRVAQLKIASSLLATKYVRIEDFSLAQEHIKTLRRSLLSHENNLLVKGSSLRVLAAADCILAQASTKLVEGQRSFNDLAKPSSLSLADKKDEYKGQIVSFKRLMNSLFASIDRDGIYYGDEPRIATKHVVTCDADGAMLAGIEALECFSQATDDNESLCASCQHSPQELWCGTCTAVDRKHSYVTPLIATIAKETQQRTGVHDALKYLHSHVGAVSVSLDTYMAEDKKSDWQGPEHARMLAYTRKKIILEIADLHAYVVNLIRNKKIGPVESSGGVVGGIVSGLNWINPLPFFSATAKSAGFKALALDEGLVDKILTLWSNYTELSKNNTEFFCESAADVQRFAELYKKPLREQLLSPRCSKQFEQLVHAWKIGGIVAPPMSLSMITRSVLSSDSTIVRGTSKNIAPGIVLGGNESYAALLQKIKKKKEDEHPVEHSTAH
jgi:hypothetical protein